MARFIKSQSLTLLEKLDALDADEQAAMCERLHELAEELQNSIQIRKVALACIDGLGVGLLGELLVLVINLG